MEPFLLKFFLRYIIIKKVRRCSMNTVKKNYIYNLLYYFTNIFISIVLLPYVSRVLGSEGVGTYSYTYNIVMYFALFSLLGIKNYGNRLIAGTRDNKEQMSKEFFSLYIVQFIMSLLVIIFYLFYIIFICKYNKLIAFIQIFYLVASMLNINWFFYGIEKFKVTTITNFLSKLLCFFSILIFVKDPSDTFIYIIIMSLYTVISNLMFIPFLKRDIKFVKVTKEDIVKHIKPCLILFIPEIAVGIYTVLDKIILGSISGVVEVGYFEQALKIINIPLCISEALALTILPKMSNLISNDKGNKVKEYMEYSMQFIMFLIIPIVFGLIFISHDFVLIFLGEEFIKSGLLLKGLTFSILFMTWGSVLRTHYLIPKKKDKIFVISVTLAALVNVLCNILLIPEYASIGAVIATIMAEFTVVLVQTIYLRKKISIIKYFKLIIPFILKSFVMILLINIFNYIKLDNLILKLLLQVGSGIIIYALLNSKYIKYLLGDIKLFKNKH